MKPVLVKWCDVASLNGWRDVAEIVDYEPVVVESLGFEFWNDGSKVILVQSFLKDDTDTKYGNPLMIPRGCVIDIEELG
jgi:hypothetical protein